MRPRFALVGFILVIAISIGCNFLTGTSQPSSAQIKVANTHARGSSNFPGCNNLPLTRQYGICFVAYAPDNSGELTKPEADMVLAVDGETAVIDLPPGSYQVQEWQADMEISADANYSPCFKRYVRPLETIEIPSETEIVFGSQRTLPSPGDFVEGKTLNPRCLITQPAKVSADTPAAPPEAPAAPPDTPEAEQVEAPNPTKVAYVDGFAGTWDTNWGEMTCRVDGLKVHCEYTWDQGRIDASLSADGRTMEGQWAESPSYSPPEDGGRVTFTLSQDGRTIDGYWWYGQDVDGGAWTGTRRQ